MDEWGALSAWCLEQFGAEPAREIFGRRQASHVTGLELTDGRQLVVKARHDENGRAATCVAVQERLADLGFPCARPLTPVTFRGGEAVHAEEWRPGGEVRTGDDPTTAAAFGQLFARAQSLTAACPESPPLPPPPWVDWTAEVAFPQLWWQPDWVRTAPMPEIIWWASDRVRQRLRATGLPSVLGHADWEAQNIRWRGDEPFVVHDWDSLAWLPEAALAGAAAGSFASNASPTLAPVESSAAFLDAYQSARDRRFSREEAEVAWAASLWPALFNARIQLMYDRPPVALEAVERQSHQRLTLASA
ncbi:phosphotransferase [Nakamurella deserti]|uniref:phosphotransferase n=1 Tax=Nakamurella deserti TaxID=2164074 RepID=UPI00197C4902|nr:phosphotransferase [Nakamurella deserti]